MSTVTIYNCIYAQPVDELKRELVACMRHAIPYGGLYRAALELPAALHPHPLKPSVLHFTFESAVFTDADITIPQIDGIKQLVQSPPTREHLVVINISPHQEYCIPSL